ncbi:hypothetical protein DXA57_03015 [Blautia sp. OF03-15BH]|uniref:C40 family peptidase n=1 Tax=Blautia sp. OF03-15BH TaxID=2292287 RepID=UPI000E4C0C92|nr:NlpC/P60 family protein [Blautia sp. OF03-15BH]RGY02259.1 hypothetical protein DXA57_03015 [Blautia sp. OF03-15BH]
MNKKLVVALLAGGLILGFPAAPKAAGNVSVPGSLHEVEKRGVQKVGTKYYYFDPKTGVRKKGLLSVSGKMYYFTSRWYAVKGFHRVNGRLLFTNERGLVCRPSGLVVQAGRRYYFDPKTGKKKTGWIRIGSQEYYFNRINGRALTGWRTVKGKKYYFNARGILLSNRWIGPNYYVDDDGSMHKGWLQLGDETYYLDEKTGRMKKGFVTIKNKTYYFDEEGLLTRGSWVENCYLDENGQMQKNSWIGAWYVGEDGKKTGKKRTPGFFTENNKTFYLDGSYQKRTGWIYVGEKAYYFDEASGELQENTWIGDYYTDEYGSRVTERICTVDGKTYYFDADGLPAKGMVHVDQDSYFFDNYGVMTTGFLEVAGTKYYFMPGTGKMARSTELSLKGIRYLFDENGRVIKETKVSAGAEKGQAIADYARLFEGKPYKNGGTSLTEGADSSGFTQAVLAHFNISVPRLSAGQLTGTSSYGGSYDRPKKITVKELQPGDLVFYGNPVNHAAIYLGNGTIIHAFNEERGIIRTVYNYRTITGCARYW